ncbi:MAG: hypothetical protein ACLT0Y_07135 [Christensenellales bacterium]
MRAQRMQPKLPLAKNITCLPPTVAVELTIDYGATIRGSLRGRHAKYSPKGGCAWRWTPNWGIFAMCNKL